MQSVSQTATMARTSGQQLLDKVKDLQNGIYAGGNNNSISNWGINNEGTWVNENNVGTITLCGRSGVSGDSFAMVLGGPQQGDSVSSITFSCNTPSSVISSYSMVPYMIQPALWLRNFPRYRTFRLPLHRKQRQFPWICRRLPLPGRKVIR